MQISLELLILCPLLLAGFLLGVLNSVSKEKTMDPKVIAKIVEFALTEITNNGVSIENIDSVIYNNGCLYIDFGGKTLLFELNKIE